MSIIIVTINIRKITFYLFSFKKHLIVFITFSRYFLKPRNLNSSYYLHLYFYLLTSFNFDYCFFYYKNSIL